MIHTLADEQILATRTLNALRAHASSGTLAEWEAYRFIEGGSGLRGQLTLGLSTGLGVSIDVGLGAAVAVELIHNASLIHDDIIDEDLVRRGRPSAFAALGRDQALLLGDVLIAESFEQLATLDLPATKQVALIRVFNRCIVEASSGQAAQMNCSTDNACTLEACEDWSRRKTGALFALPVQVAFLLSPSQQCLETATAAAVELGLAYQVKDDLLDWLACKPGRAGSSDRINQQWTFARIATRDARGDEVAFMLDLLKMRRSRYETFASDLPGSVRLQLNQVADKLLALPSMNKGRRPVII